MSLFGWREREEIERLKGTERDLRESLREARRATERLEDRYLMLEREIQRARDDFHAVLAECQREKARLIEALCSRPAFEPGPGFPVDISGESMRQAGRDMQLRREAALEDERPEDAVGTVEELYEVADVHLTESGGKPPTNWTRLTLGDDEWQQAQAGPGEDAETDE